MLRRILLLSIASGILAAPAAAQSSAATDTLAGAGSTLVAPLVMRWAAAYAQAGTQVTYDAIGSGGGIAEISARTVDFGASDAPLTPAQFNLARPPSPTTCPASTAGYGSLALRSRRSTSARSRSGTTRVSARSIRASPSPR